MKRQLIGVVACATLLVTSACGGDDAGGGTGDAGSKLVYFMAPNTTPTRYIQQDGPAFEKAIKALDPSVEVKFVNAGGDSNQQLAQANAAIAAGAKALVVVAADPNTSAGLLQAAEQSKVPVIGYENPPVEPGVLLRADPDGSVTVVAPDMWFANGSVITPDGVLLVGETFGNRVSAFDLADDGSFTDRRTWAQFGELPADRELGAALGQLVVAPDGCCLDTEGAMWIADAIGGRLIRVREGGEIIDEIKVEAGVYASMLGGADGRTLYACAAPDFEEHARAAAREGTLLAVRVEVPHAGRP